MARICILLPVLNEIGNVAELCDRIELALPQPYTICFVDDGSTDGTAEYLEDRRARQPDRIHVIRRRKTTRGSQRGGALYAALRWGLSDPAFKFFVEMDGDLSHRPEELGAGLALIARGGWDVAIASKYVPGSEVLNRPFGRLAVSRLCNVMVRSLLSMRLTDYSNGYRFYTREAASSIAQTRIRFGSPIYLTEVIAIWLTHRMRIVDFPTTYVGRNEGLSKLRPTDLIKAAIAVFDIAARYHLSRLTSRNRPLPQASASPSTDLRPTVPGATVESTGDRH